MAGKDTETTGGQQAHRTRDNGEDHLRPGEGISEGARPANSEHDRGDKGRNDMQGDKGTSKGKEGDTASDKPRSKKPLIIISIVVIALALVGFFVWFAHRNQESTDDAYTDGNSVPMVPKVSGYVVQLYVNDNTHVNKGDLLLRIDQRDYLTALEQAQAQLALTEAQLKSGKNALRIARVQYPAQLESAKAQRESAAAALALAQSSFERQHRVDPRATTRESIDASTNQQSGAIASLRSAKAQETIASLVPEQVQQAADMVIQDEASVQEAQAQLDQAKLNLSYTDIRAPSEGFVTQRSVQLGRFLTAGSVMFDLVTPDFWVTANFKESQIGRMRPGDKVRIKVDAYSGYELDGHVQSIQSGSGARFSAFPAENATGNFVKIVQRVPVKIVIDRGLDPNALPPLGLSVAPVVYFR